MLDTSCRHHRLVVPGKSALSHISAGWTWTWSRTSWSPTCSLSHICGVDHRHGHVHQHHHLLFLISTCPWWNSTRSANLRLPPDLKLVPLPIVHMSTLSMPTTLSTHLQRMRRTIIAKITSTPDAPCKPPFGVRKVSLERV